MEDIIIEDINEEAKYSILKTCGEDLTAKSYITNPAIAREEEIKRLIITLLTPEKSGLLVGKPGIGKTAIVEGLSYYINRGEVPNALKGYKIIKINSTSLVGKISLNGKEELTMSVFIEEIKKINKLIIFIDEIHTLIGSKENGPMDLANILKPVIDRGDVKVIGATTTDEYHNYVIKDRAFLRRFERIDIEEPSEVDTVRILIESLPKIEKKTGIKFKYDPYIVEKMIESIVSATSEYKRVYGLSAMYPDVSFSVLTQAFSQALFSNKELVDAEDVYNAIKTSKRIYPDTIIKELKIFKEKFVDLLEEENLYLPVITINDLDIAENF